MEYIKLLAQECSELGINATNLQLKKSLLWIELLRKWNQAYNLSALHDTRQIISDLVADSLTAIPYLQHKTVLDVGSGSGVPGIPLAIFAPMYQYTLIDSNAKKVRFLEHCRLFLELPNVEIKQTRAENFTSVAKFDTIISRALCRLDRFISLTLHLAHKQTHWLAFKGKIDQQELQKLRCVEANLGLRHSLQALHSRRQKLRNLVLVRY